MDEPTVPPCLLPAPPKPTPSRGQRTPQGKAIVARNATKHGLLAANLGADEDKAAHRRLRDAVYYEWQPEGATEEALTEMLVAQLWRLRRRLICEAELLDIDYIAYLKNIDIPYKENPLELLARYKGKVRNGLTDILRELRIAQTRRQNYRLMRVEPDGSLAEPILESKPRGRTRHAHHGPGDLYQVEGPVFTNDGSTR